VIRDRDWPISTRWPKVSFRAASTATISVILGLAGAAQAADLAASRVLDDLTAWLATHQ